MTLPAPNGRFPITDDEIYKGCIIREMACGYTCVIRNGKVLRDFVTPNPTLRRKQAKEFINGWD
jgi:hypothetical protein